LRSDGPKMNYASKSTPFQEKTSPRFAESLQKDRLNTLFIPPAPPEARRNDRPRAPLGPAVRKHSWPVGRRLRRRHRRSPSSSPIDSSLQLLPQYKLSDPAAQDGRPKRYLRMLGSGVSAGRNTCALDVEGTEDLGDFSCDSYSIIERGTAPQRRQGVVLCGRSAKTTFLAVGW